MAEHQNIRDFSDNDVTPIDSYDLKYFDYIMGVLLPAIICTIGILGNALALIVLAHDRTNCPTLLSLRALATSDLLLLSAAFVQQVIPMYCDKSENHSTFCRHQGYPKVYSWPIVCIAQMMSIWYTVIISSERFLAICYPLQTAHWRTLGRVRFAILLVVVLAVLFNVPKFFEYSPIQRYNVMHNYTYIDVGGTYLRNDIVYRYLYNTALYCLTIYLLPLSILTILNFRIVKDMRKARKQWEQLNRNQQRELKATVLPLCIVLVFFICQTQSLAGFILDAIYVRNRLWLQVYTAILNLLVMLNSAINFLLMYIFGRKFRSLLKNTFRCKKTLQSPSIKERFV